MKKFLIRLIGSLCILASLALMLMPGWIQAKDVDRKALRDTRSDVEGMLAAAEDRYLLLLDNMSGFKEEVKDYDLPYTPSRVKSRFRQLGNLSDSLLDRDLSLFELYTLSMKAPEVLEDVENLLDSDAADAVFIAVAQYTLSESSQANPDSSLSASELSDFYQDAALDSLEGIFDVSFLLMIPAVFIILVVTLAIVSAVTHMCNKVRWFKYLYLFILVAMVAGTCVALSLTSDMLAELVKTVPAFADMRLQITITPFIAVALMFVPMILDIVYERKKSLPQEQPQAQVQSAEA